MHSLYKYSLFLFSLKLVVQFNYIYNIVSIRRFCRKVRKGLIRIFDLLRAINDLAELGVMWFTVFSLSCLSVLRSVGEILRANNAVLKRVGITPNMAETIENTGAPNHPRSRLLHRNALGQVPWLVNIAATHYRNFIRKQL